MSGSVIQFPRGREVVLGIGAGIAAYKSCDLLRRLQDHGYLVTVIPTPSSLNFVGRTTWEALSGRPVRTDVFTDADHVSHVALGERADLIVVAPATADLISRIAQGRADDLLTTTVLASQAPIVIVPAMHPAMWLNPATVANVETLRARGITVLDPDVGRLTGKDSGVGRFPETATIIEAIKKISGNSLSLLDKKVLVTAGGTREAIDPVRFIGNRSSGRQGLAIAHRALCEGAEVTVIAGATDPFELEGARIIHVDSALSMAAAIDMEFSSHDALVMSAAVADVRPLSFSGEKIKKDALESLQLVRNPDILATIAKKRTSNQVLVGFAAETGSDIEKEGTRKLFNKGVDLLYVTDVSDGRVFGELTTSGSLLEADLPPHRFVGSDKYEVARVIVDRLSVHLKKSRRS